MEEQRVVGSAYTPEQRKALEDVFEIWGSLSKHEEKEKISALSVEIGLTSVQIRGWLQNRKKRGLYKGKQVLEPNQVRALEWIFVKHSNYPSVRMKEKLSSELDLSYNRVRTWFQSRRQRGVPAILQRTSFDETPEWLETVKTLERVVGEVKREESFFVSRFPDDDDDNAPEYGRESPTFSDHSAASQLTELARLSEASLPPTKTSGSFCGSIPKSPTLFERRNSLPMGLDAVPSRAAQIPRHQAPSHSQFGSSGSLTSPLSSSSLTPNFQMMKLVVPADSSFLKSLPTQPWGADSGSVSELPRKRMRFTSSPTPEKRPQIPLAYPRSTELRNSNFGSLHIPPRLSPLGSVSFAEKFRKIDSDPVKTSLPPAGSSRWDLFSNSPLPFSLPELRETKRPEGFDGITLPPLSELAKAIEKQEES